MTNVIVSGKNTAANSNFLKWASKNVNKSWPEFAIIDDKIRKMLKDNGISRLPAMKYEGSWINGAENVKSALEDMSKEKNPVKKNAREHVSYNAVSESVASMQSSGNGGPVRFDGGFEVPMERIRRIPEMKSPDTQDKYSAVSSKSRANEEFTEEELDARTKLVIDAERNPVVGAATENAGAFMDNSADAMNLASLNASAAVGVNSSDSTAEFDSRDAGLVSTMYEGSVVGSAGFDNNEFVMNAF